MTDSCTRTIGDLLSADGGADGYRPPELALLASCLADDGPLFAWVHGPDGCGKTSLLQAFCERARDAGASAIRIDCRTVEPTIGGLMAALGELFGRPLDDIEAAAACIAGSAGRVVLAFDNYEVFRLADAWLRREFIPALGADTRIVLVSSEPPAAGWISARQWRQFLLEVPLSPVVAGVPEMHATELLDTIERPDVRRSVEAISVVRRITRPMLAALCPQTPADELYETLSSLDFVESRRDGLALSDTATTSGPHGTCCANSCWVHPERICGVSPPMRSTSSRTR